MALKSVICLYALCCVLHAAEDVKTIGPRTTAFLVTDYLPPAIYEGDGLAACFRIENGLGVNSAFEMSAKAVDAANLDVKTPVEKADAAPHAFASVQFEINSKRVAQIHFELRRSGDTDVLARENVVLVRDDDAWPETKIANGRLVLAQGGATVIPVVQKKRAVEERAFAPMKWVFGSHGDGAAEGNTRVFVPGAWHLNIDGADALGPWPLDGSIPIIRTLERVMTVLMLAPRKAGDNVTGLNVRRVAIVLPPEDLDLATDPRTYRVALDALQARLTKMGVARIVLISPYKYGCNEAHRKTLWREIRESAAVNSSKVIDPLDWMGETQWRADPATPKIYFDRPNAAGQKMIEQALANLIR